MNFERTTTESGNIVLAFLVLLICGIILIAVSYGSIETLVQATSGQSLADILTIFP